MLADATDRTIVRVTDPWLAGLRGSALFAALALGRVERSEVRGLVPTDPPVRPDPRHRATYDALGRGLPKLYAAQRGFFRRSARRSLERTPAVGVGEDELGVGEQHPRRVPLDLVAAAAAHLVGEPLDGRAGPAGLVLDQSRPDLGPLLAKDSSAAWLTPPSAASADSTLAIVRYWAVTMRLLPTGPMKAGVG